MCRKTSAGEGGEAERWKNRSRKKDCRNFYLFGEIKLRSRVSGKQ
jgi:hypothetical protein